MGDPTVREQRHMPLRRVHESTSDISVEMTAKPAPRRLKESPILLAGNGEFFTPDGESLLRKYIKSDFGISLEEFIPKYIKRYFGFFREQQVYSLTISPDNKTLATASYDDLVQLWDLSGDTPKEKYTMEILDKHNIGAMSVAFSPDSRTLACCGNGMEEVKLWDVSGDTLKMKGSLNGHQHDVDCAAFSPDGKTLASGSQDSTVKLWDVDTKECKATLTGHPLGVNCVAFSPDGKTLASGSDDRAVRLWDVETKECTAILRGHTFDNPECICSHGDMDWDGIDDQEEIWQDAFFHYKANILCPVVGHLESVKSVAFSPDGKTLASGSDDTTIVLWDIAKKQGKATLTGHSREVNCVAFSPDGKTLASGSCDNTIKLWDVSGDTPEVYKTLKCKDEVHAVAFSSDDAMLAYGGINQVVVLPNTKYAKYAEYLSMLSQVGKTWGGKHFSKLDDFLSAKIIDHLLDMIKNKRGDFNNSPV